MCCFYLSRSCCVPERLVLLECGASTTCTVAKKKTNDVTRKTIESTAPLSEEPIRVTRPHDTMIPMVHHCAEKGVNGHYISKRAR